MKNAYLGVGVIVMGLAALILVAFVNSATFNSEFDYSAMKNVTSAAMEDAIAFDPMELTSKPKIDKMKFMESFLRRFAEEADINREYTIKISKIIEDPPTVILNIDSKTLYAVQGETQPVITTPVTMIIETNNYNASETARKMAINNNAAKKPLNNPVNKGVIEKKKNDKV